MRYNSHGKPAKKITKASLPEVPLVPEIEWAWAAGFIDGEGSIGIHQRQAFGFALVFTVVNTNEDAMKRMAKLMCKNPKRKLDYARICSFGTSRLPIFVLKCTGVHAQIFLKQIYPYTTVKRRNIEVALQFPLSHRSAKNKDYIMSIQTKLREEMLALNKVNQCRDSQKDKGN